MAVERLTCPKCGEKAATRHCGDKPEHRLRCAWLRCTRCKATSDPVRRIGLLRNGQRFDLPPVSQ